jgi:hypothetical protein
VQSSSVASDTILSKILWVSLISTICDKGHPPQIFLGLQHLFSWYLLRWLSISMSHLPNYFNKSLFSHTLRLLSRGRFPSVD